MIHFLLTFLYRKVNSKRYSQTKHNYTEIKRKQAQQRLLSHKHLANKIVEQGNTIIVEQMSFKGLQARAKDTKTNEETGRIRSKKRFGKTIAHRAPALLISQIKYKAEYAGNTFIEANTREIKASQLDHVTGLYTKVPLSTRTKEIGCELVQRDLYSAFLLQHVNLDGQTIDLQACDNDFAAFLRNQQLTMETLETTLSSTGRNKFSHHPESDNFS